MNPDHAMDIFNSYVNKTKAQLFVLRCNYLTFHSHHELFIICHIGWYGGHNNTLKDVHVLILRTCEYIIFMTKGHFRCDKDLEMGRCHHRSPKIGEPHGCGQGKGCDDKNRIREKVSKVKYYKLWRWRKGPLARGILQNLGNRSKQGNRRVRASRRNAVLLTLDFSPVSFLAYRTVRCYKIGGKL